MQRSEEVRSVLTPQAFWAILASGRQPTVDLVSEWMSTHGHGKPNRTVISHGIKSCWAEVGKKVALYDSIPGIPPETVRLVIALRDDMLAVARHELDEEKVEIERNAAASVEAAHGRLAMAESDRDHARSQLQNAVERVAVAEGRIKELEGIVAAVEAAAGRDRDALTKAAVEIDDLKGQLRLRDGQIEQLRRDHQAELHAERANAETERKRLLREVDRAREEAAAHEKATVQAVQRVEDLVQVERRLLADVADLRAAIASKESALQAASDLQQDLRLQINDANARIQVLNSDIASSGALAAERGALLDQAQHRLAELAGMNVQTLVTLVATAYMQGCAAKDGQKDQGHAETAAVDLLGRAGVHVQPVKKPRAR